MRRKNAWLLVLDVRDCIAGSCNSDCFSSSVFSLFLALSSANSWVIWHLSDSPNFAAPLTIYYIYGLVNYFMIYFRSFFFKSTLNKSSKKYFSSSSSYVFYNLWKFYNLLPFSKCLRTWMRKDKCEIEREMRTSVQSSRPSSEQRWEVRISTTSSTSFFKISLSKFESSKTGMLFAIEA